MQIRITPGMQISELQSVFNARFPYLKIDFYKQLPCTKNSRQPLDGSLTFNQIGIKHELTLELQATMTVHELEKILKNHGLQSQVSRHSGQVWLETTMTDSWTLMQQNEQGKELSAPFKNVPGIGPELA